MGLNRFSSCTHYSPLWYIALKLTEMPGNNPEEVSIRQSDTALPCDFSSKFYFDLKMPKKGSLNRGILVSATAIYQTNCPFTVLRVLFLFFQALPYDSKLFPGCHYQTVKSTERILKKLCKGLATMVGQRRNACFVIFRINHFQKK